MKIEVINTGSELMLGRVLNTHQQWICRRLADQGYVVTRQIAVGDTGRDIQQAVRESLARARLVIETGGLGPTSDDLTRDVIAELLDKKLREDAAALRVAGTRGQELRIEAALRVLRVRPLQGRPVVQLGLV